MKLSKWGQKITSESGILKLMDDLGKAMSGGSVTAMFGGGNPAHIPAVQTALKTELKTIANSDQLSTEALNNYDTPQGNTKFIKTLVKFLNEQLDWPVTAANIAVTPGSQTGFFILFNLLAGQMASGRRHILLPLAPEYIGYLDQGLSNDMFKAAKPEIELIGQHEFKYHVDINSLKIDDSVGAVCLSRPTNPTGNVITHGELTSVRKLAGKKGVPLIIDCAYGLPFPGIVEDLTGLDWAQDLVVSLSLSKVGLPGVRTGIFIAREDIAAAITKTTAIVSLANPNIGQLLVEPMLKSGELLRLSRDIIKPYYADKVAYARRAFSKAFDPDLPYRIHKHEGSYFFWLWLDKLPITTKELYQRLKKHGVIVVPGEYFFPASMHGWPHARQCLRLNIARPKAEIDTGFAIMAKEIAKIYAR